MMSCGCGKEQTRSVVKLQAQVARLEGEKAAMAAALEKIAGLVSPIRIEKFYSSPALADIECIVSLARDALFGEGKVWEQVEKALKAIQKQATGLPGRDGGCSFGKLSSP